MSLKKSIIFCYAIVDGKRGEVDIKITQEELKAIDLEDAKEAAHRFLIDKEKPSNWSKSYVPLYVENVKSRERKDLLDWPRALSVGLNLREWMKDCLKDLISMLSR